MFSFRATRGMSAMPSPDTATDTGLPRLLEIIRRLRNPDGGCPWDSTRTLPDIAGCLVGEAEEAAEALNADDPRHQCEELGDVLLNVILAAVIAEEGGRFSWRDVVAGITEKLIRRHPHVFGGRKAATPEEALAMFLEAKAAEKKRPAKWRLIACKVLDEEVKGLMRLLGKEDALDVSYLEMGLHDQPERLKRELAQQVADCSGKGYEAVLLLYGLCSNAIAGLAAPADSPLIIPRAHDCMTLFLGSARKYAAEHAAEAGTYWFARGFLHREEGNAMDAGFMGLGGESEYSPARREEIRRKYVEEYGEDNADYLMEVLVDSWRRNYRRAVFLRGDYPEAEADAGKVAAFAKENDWRYEEMPVDLRLVRGLLEGTWPEGDFLRVDPGMKVVASHEAGVVAAATA